MKIPLPLMIVLTLFVVAAGLNVGVLVGAVITYLVRTR